MSGSTFVGLRNRPVLKSICAYIELSLPDVIYIYSLKFAFEVRIRS